MMIIEICRLPIVVKVGYAEAGYGKMKFEQQDQLTDFRRYLAQLRQIR